MVQRVSVVKVDSNNNDIIPLNIDSSGNLGIQATITGGSITNAVLTAVEDQTTHYLGTKDVALNAIIASSKLAVADAVLDACIAGNVVAVGGAVTNAILTAVEDQTTHYLATKDVTLNAGTSFLGFISQEHEKEPQLTSTNLKGKSLLTGTAASGQAVCAVADGTKFATGNVVQIADSNASEYNTVLSVASNNVTMTTNLAHTYTTAATGFVTGAYTQAVQDRFSYPYFPYTVRGKVFATQACSLYVWESENADKSTASILLTVAVTASTTTVLSPVQLTKRYFWVELVNTAATATTSCVLTQAVGTAQKVSTCYMHNALATATSTGTDMLVYGMKMLAVQVKGTATYTLDFEASVDGTNFVASQTVTNTADGGDYTSITSDGIYSFMCAGMKWFRANVTANAGASLTVFARAVA